MNVKQTDNYIPWLLRWQRPSKTRGNTGNVVYKSRWHRLRRFVLRHGFRIAAIVFTLLVLGRNSFTPEELAKQTIHSTVTGWEFDLLRWEIDSSRTKVALIGNDPTTEMSGEESAALVCSYMDRSQKIAELEKKIIEKSAAETQAELDTLRNQQQAERAQVESVIQQQIGSELIDEGITVAGRAFPPVLFSFTEPPKKMVVSPRDRIEIVYSEMLDAGIDMETIEGSEETIQTDQGLSAYITNIGGLGAFPTMVIDRASLRWILSTVAHEWTHNYLTLYPLGINYATSAELTILNETVAEIVGNEIGDRAMDRYFPNQCKEPDDTNQETAEEGGDSDEDEFIFRDEMRETRIAVDQYLEDGLVDEAEYYMELRRLDFVENGYNLRVLNQAYFAFHGSYGTSAASTSDIGPKLELLREQSPDLATFLRDVRWLTSPSGIDDL